MKKSIIPVAVLLYTCAFFLVAYAGDIIETKSGLKYEELVIGNGNKATPQKIATINITIWKNTNGFKGEQLYTTTRDEASAISFKLGTKRVADGLNQGVIGMREGGKRKLIVPANLNPKMTSGKFPGNADLIYEVELLKVR